MIETPSRLVERSREQQAATPYFGLGFAKAGIPPALHEELAGRVRSCGHLFRPDAAAEEVGSVDPAVLPAVRFEDPQLGEGPGSALRARLESWSGMPLIPAAGGVFRAFQRGSYELHHVDLAGRSGARIVTSTLCVARKLDEPWPFCIEDIEGRVHEIDLAPGEMVIYEGARLLHGRPRPLKGVDFLELTLHCRPLGLGPLSRSSDPSEARSPASRPPRLGFVRA